jgi:hypothetical protein
MNKPNFIRYLGIVNSEKYIKFIEDNNIQFEENFNYDRKDYFNNCKNFFLVERFNINHKKLTQDFFDISNNLFKILNDYFGDGTIYNIQFSLMPPKSEVKEHYDYGLSFSLSNRIHLPIKTNDKVLFFIGDQNFNLKSNKLVEINNKKIHSVSNNSEDEYRIHLIIDYLQLRYVNYCK